jgi:hypothetical protein
VGGDGGDGERELAESADEVVDAEFVVGCGGGRVSSGGGILVAPVDTINGEPVEPLLLTGAGRNINRRGFVGCERLPSMLLVAVAVEVEVEGAEPPLVVRTATGGDTKRNAPALGSGECGGDIALDGDDDVADEWGNNFETGGDIAVGVGVVGGELIHACGVVGIVNVKWGDIKGEGSGEGIGEGPERGEVGKIRGAGGGGSW